MKKYVCGILVMLMSYTVQARDIHDNLFECVVSDSETDDRILFKAISVNGGRTEFMMWNNYGSVDNRNPDRYGDVGAAHSRMTSTEQAYDFGFGEDGDDYVFAANYSANGGSEIFIQFTYIGRDQDGENAYDMTMSGDGQEYSNLIDNYNETLNESEFYNPGEAVRCYEREDLGRY